MTAALKIINSSLFPQSDHTNWSPQGVSHSGAHPGHPESDLFTGGRVQERQPRTFFLYVTFYRTIADILSTAFETTHHSALHRQPWQQLRLLPDSETTTNDHRTQACRPISHRQQTARRQPSTAATSSSTTTTIPHSTPPTTTRPMITRPTIHQPATIHKRNPPLRAGCWT